MKLKNRRFIVYGTKKCEFCAMARELLEEQNIAFDVINFDSRPKILKEIKQVYDWKTVPMIFEKLEDSSFKLVGGYTDLLNYLGGE